MAGCVTNLSRSRSAQSLKVVADSASRDDKMSVLAQLFWIATFVLESDYEYEFLLALRLLNKVLSHLPLDRPDCREKLERIQMRMKWTAFPGLHALVLKGLTNKDTYESALALISKFTTLMDLSVVDPSGTVGFPINVMALLPYMIHHYEDANDLCIRSAENIAQVRFKKRSFPHAITWKSNCASVRIFAFLGQVSLEKSSKLENLATVMTLYSHRNFSKESFQWTKCVVKYLHDAYSHLSLVMITFLVEVCCHSIFAVSTLNGLQRYYVTNLYFGRCWRKVQPWSKPQSSTSSIASSITSIFTLSNLQSSMEIYSVLLLALSRSVATRPFGFMGISSFQAIMKAPFCSKM